MDTANKKVKDISGSGIDAQQKGNVEVAEGKEGGNGISMDGEIGGYVKLSSDLTKNTKEATMEQDCLNLAIWMEMYSRYLLKAQTNCP